MLSTIYHVVNIFTLLYYLIKRLSRHPFPRVFSHCSKRDLDRYLQKGGGMCLYNMPNMKDLVGGKKCGNGFVEEGEECDCGVPDVSIFKTSKITAQTFNRLLYL